MLPRGLRNNNPGNIEDGPFARSLPGYAGSDGRFAQFNSTQDGLGAIDHLLQGYGKKGINSVSGVINRWAPSSDGNDVGAYANHVSGVLGVNPNDPIDLNDPDTRGKLAQGIAEHENGVGPLRLAMAGGDNNVPQPIQMGPGALSPQQAPQVPDDDQGFLSRLMQGNGVPGSDLGTALQTAGAGLLSINNPAGGAAMLNAANAPLFKNRFSVITNKMGQQMIFDTHRGVMIDPSAPQQRVAGSGTPAAGAPGAPAPTNMTEALAQSPIALAKRTELDQEESAKKMAALEEAATTAKVMNDRIDNEFLPLVRDPTVKQGAGAEAIKNAKSWARTLTLGGWTPPGTTQSALLDKGFNDLVGMRLENQRGVRFAAPEINYGKTSTAELDKPNEANEQILQDYHKDNERLIAARDIARKHMSTYGVLGPKYSEELQQHMDQHPEYTPDAVKPTNAGGNSRPPLSSFQR